jgi:tetratricopeptide (TPR) repeat protein
MHSYSVRDIERVLQLSRGTIRGLVSGGFVKPARGPRHEYRFSFRDLVVLRAARTLIRAQVPARRIRRSLQDLRQHLPESLPLSGLSICAIGDRVVVREGRSHWDVNDGQYLLGLDVSVDDGVLRVSDWPETVHADTRETDPAAGADDWFEKGLGVESADPRAALRAYQHAVEHCGPDPLLLFNLGVLLEDLGRTGPALDAYQRAIGEDPTLADCHYNLARLYESIGKPQHAIRHLGQYRRLLISETR